MVRTGRFLMNLGGSSKNLVTIVGTVVGGTNLCIRVERGELNPVWLTRRNNIDSVTISIDQFGCIWLHFKNDDDYIAFMEHFTPLKFVKWEGTGAYAHAIFVEPESLNVGRLNVLNWDIDDKFVGEED